MGIVHKFNRIVFLSGYLYTYTILSGCAGGTPDITPPARVEDLAVQSVSENTVVLTWTAPGDDGNIGQAVKYDIRYSTEEINKQNWSTAKQVYDEPEPQTSGSTETYTVKNLEHKKLYYFAIKTYDDVNNISPLSITTYAVTGDVSGGSGTWNSISAPPPVNLKDLKGTLNTSNGEIFFYGNGNSLSFDPTGQNWSVISASRPEQNVGFILEFLENQNKFFIYGGLSNQGFVNSSWYFDPVTGNWSEITTINPDARLGSCSVIDSDGNVILFGGKSKNGGFINDTLIFNTLQQQWEYLSPAGIRPDERFFPSCIWLEDYNAMMVIGGANNFKIFNDIWILDFNGTSPVWEQIFPDNQGPEGIYGAGAFFDKDFSRIVLMGGFKTQDQQANEDVWSIYVSSGIKAKWIKLKPEGTPPDFSQNGEVIFVYSSRDAYFLSYKENSIFLLDF